MRQKKVTAQDSSGSTYAYDVTTATVITPSAVGTDTLAVTNLIARGYDPTVTSGGALIKSMS